MKKQETVKCSEMVTPIRKAYSSGPADSRHCEKAGKYEVAGKMYCQVHARHKRTWEYQKLLQQTTNDVSLTPTQVQILVDAYWG